MTRPIVLLTLLVAIVPADAGAVRIAAVGDIASCTWTADKATGDLVRAIKPKVVVTLGDNAYPHGSFSQFKNCYDPPWGSFKRKTRPAPGNHEYHTPEAAGYFRYFGKRAGRCCRGYYKYKVGAWRLYSLNSERRVATQVRWLRKNLRAHPHACTLAYWHQPRFSDGTVHGDSAAVDPLWDAFAANGGDVVLAGHDHSYQRFPRRHGVRSFVVGSGGAPLYDVVPKRVAAYDDSHHGILRFKLRDGSYAWKFRRVGGAAADQGNANCRN